MISTFQNISDLLFVKSWYKPISFFENLLIQKNIIKRSYPILLKRRNIHNQFNWYSQPNSTEKAFVSSKVHFHVKKYQMDSLPKMRVEELIQRCVGEISALIERNHSIQDLAEEELKKEHAENEILLKQKLQELQKLNSTPGEPLQLAENRNKLENLIKRKFIYANAFEIYGGMSGLFDYGPSGCLLKSELENLWRQHFIYYDEMLEISATCVTPYAVLKSSGHVDRFTDLMIRDEVTKDCYRADKFLAEWLEGKKKELDKKAEKRMEEETKNVMQEIQEIELIIRKLDGMGETEIKEVIEKYQIKSPLNNKFSDPYPFNLMFKTKIGPGGVEQDVTEKTEKKSFSDVAYLRPETAQGIFVNFKKLLDCNGNKMPFAGAQIGLGFRNEISPRNGLLRVREFQMAEIEYFVNPKRKTHEKYFLFQHVMLPLYPRDKQLTDGQIIRDLTVDQAIKKGIIGNEALGYFLARTYLFLLKCGISKEGIRFRQHLSTEMAHYASDCWDAEILTSFGFIEVVGHADRSAFDLTNHSKVTNANLQACEKFEEPIQMEFVKIMPNRALIGKQFKNEQNIIYEALNEKSNEELLAIDQELSTKGTYTLTVCNAKTPFSLTREMISFQKYTKTVQEETFIPNVIEPSFGIGRLIFCILEHSFRIREFTDDKEERNYLALPHKLAPIKCSIFSISNNKSFFPFVKKVQMTLNEFGISSKIDNSGVSIGKKYARADEIGIPFAVTVDFQTVKDKTVTLRERDSMTQIRIQTSEIVDILNSLFQQRNSWGEYISKYGLFTQQEL